MMMRKLKFLLFERVYQKDDDFVQPVVVPKFPMMADAVWFHAEHGFQRNRFTITAVLQSMNDWTVSLDKDVHGNTAGDQAVVCTPNKSY